MTVSMLVAKEASSQGGFDDIHHYQAYISIYPLLLLVIYVTMYSEGNVPLHWRGKNKQGNIYSQ